MTLSILTDIDGITKYLYDSSSNRVLMSGTDSEISEWKHKMEQLEQQKLNKAHFDELKKEYLALLIKQGNPIEKAEEFLKEKMPFLFQNTVPCKN